MFALKGVSSGKNHKRRIINIISLSFNIHKHEEDLRPNGVNYLEL